MILDCSNRGSQGLTSAICNKFTTQIKMANNGWMGFNQQSKKWP